ncbi:30S ribosomal protein S8 [Candidatus Amesbacteria bacterium]|nr:30S ribosomal protein S8 [Candidatus Amesbacteria bacterium]MBI2587570.1 30S ribosomal protein S8 [Candidatus Amesbacteria bacterium]
MVNDPVSDFVARIRNGYRAQLRVVEVPATRLVRRVAEELSQAGFIGEVKEENGVLTLGLKYKGKEPAITGIRRVSKPGARIYAGAGGIPRVLGGLGMNILTTPKGIMSEKKAKKLKVGGEIICQVW